MRLDIRIDGDVDKLMRSEFKAGQRAVSTAMRIAGDGLKNNWRSQVIAAGFGVRMSKAVRSEVFPKGQPSMNAAVLVYTKSPKVFSAHEKGALIRAKDGVWLAIPLPAAGRGPNGSRMTPAQWEAKNGRVLRFVYWGGRIAKLVDDGTRSFRRTGDSLAWTNRRAGLRTKKKSVAIFTLVPQVTLKKRLNLMSAGEAAQSRVPGLIVANWKGAN